MENKENLNKNDIEIVSGHNRKEQEFIRKLEKNQFKAMTTFKKIKNLYSDGIVPKIKHHKRVVGNSLKGLMGDDDDEKNKLKLKKRKELKELQNSKSYNNQSHMSDTAKQLSEKINFQVLKIKKSQDDLTALNALYLDNKIFFNKEINNKNNNRYNDNNNMNNNSINNNSIGKEEKKEDISNYSKGIGQKKYRNNFDFMANSYRKQLNGAFSKYNPDKYLNNLKTLIQASPTLRDEVSNLKKEIEVDIKNITDKYKLQKKYQQFLQKNIKSKSTATLNPKLYKSDEIIKKSNTSKNSVMRNKDEKIILPSIGKDKISVNIINRNNLVKIGKIRRIERMDSKKMMNIKELQYDHMNRLHNISQEIQNYIGNENIGEKINSFLQDFNLQKSINLYKTDNDKQESSIKQKNYYAKQDKKINDLFGDLYINRLQAKILEKERKLTDKLRNNNYDYFNKIRNDMKHSLNEFDKNTNLNMANNEDNNPSDPGAFVF